MSGYASRVAIAACPNCDARLSHSQRSVLHAKPTGHMNLKMIKVENDHWDLNEVL